MSEVTGGRWETVDTWWVKIYLAGDIGVAKQVLREQCFAYKLCVTVEPCEYIYTGGQEAGYCIGLINYPKFPKSKEEIVHIATNIALGLVEATHQWSFTLMTPDKTSWFTRRSDD